jgi:hypothetical protein
MMTNIKFSFKGKLKMMSKSLMVLKLPKMILKRLLKNPLRKLEHAVRPRLHPSYNLKIIHWIKSLEA